MDDVIDSDHLPKVSLISSSKWFKVRMMVIIPVKYSNVFASLFHHKNGTQQTALQGLSILFSFSFLRETFF